MGNRKKQRKSKTVSVLLLAKVSGLGEKGEIKSVKRGYFLNYLLPQKLAVLADEKIKTERLKQREEQAKEKEKVLQEAEKMRKKIPKLMVFRVRANKKGELYESFKPEKVVKKLKVQDVVREVSLDGKKKVKTLGKFTAELLFVDGKKVTIEVELKPKRDK